MRVVGTELKSSCLCGKCFIDWCSSLALRFLILRGPLCQQSHSTNRSKMSPLVSGKFSSLFSDLSFGGFAMICCASENLWNNFITETSITSSLGRAKVRTHVTMRSCDQRATKLELLRKADISDSIFVAGFETGSSYEALAVLKFKTPLLQPPCPVWVHLSWWLPFLLLSNFLWRHWWLAIWFDISFPLLLWQDLSQMG